MGLGFSRDEISEILKEMEEVETLEEIMERIIGRHIKKTVKELKKVNDDEDCPKPQTVH